MTTNQILIGTGIVLLAYIILVKLPKKEESKSNIGGYGSLLTPDAKCISKAMMNGNTLEEAQIWCRATKVANTESETKLNACGCGS